MLQFIEKYFKMIPVKFRFTAVVLLAFGSFLSFVTADSYYADVHHVRGLFFVLGSLLAVVVVSILVIANNENSKDR